MSSQELTVSEARQGLAAVIDRARVQHSPVYLARRSLRIAAVIDADDLDELISLAEDMSDILAAEATRAEMAATGEAPISWEQVRSISASRDIPDRPRTVCCENAARTSHPARRRVQAALEILAEQPGLPVPSSW